LYAFMGLGSDLDPGTGMSRHIDQDLVQDGQDPHRCPSQMMLKNSSNSWEG
jgi:hypothetical protein